MPAISAPDEANSQVSESEKAQNREKANNSEEAQNREEAQKNHAAEKEERLFENINEASRNARQIYFILVAYLGYIALTVSTTSDKDIVLNSTTELPIIGVTVSVYGFFVIAPILAGIIYLYFQLYVQRNMTLILDYQKLVPGSDQRDFYPWMLNIASKSDEGFAGVMQSLIVKLSLWWLLPITIMLFAVFILKTHAPVLMYVIGLGYPIVGITMVSLFWCCHENTGKAGMKIPIGVYFLASISIVILLVIAFYLIPLAKTGISWRSNNHIPLERVLRSVVSVDLSYENLSNVTDEIAKLDLPWANLKDSHLQGGNLSSAYLVNADLRFSDLRNANLVNANLSRSLLEGADLRGALLDFANLEGANLKDAKLENAKMTQANLTKAVLKGAHLSNAQMRYVDLEGADLKDADLSEADLYYTNLERANLYDTVLCKADLRNTNLKEADLRYTNLYRSKISGAKLLQANLSETYAVDVVGLDFKELENTSSMYQAKLGEDKLAAFKAYMQDANKTATFVDQLLNQDQEKIWMYEAQERLDELGLYYGAIDGVIGPITRKAIRKYQEKNQEKYQLEINERLDYQTRQHILEGKTQIASTKQMDNFARQTLNKNIEHGLDAAKMTFENLMSILKTNGLYEGEEIDQSNITYQQYNDFVQAVKRFQVAVGITPDGLVGIDTGKNLHCAQEQNLAYSNLIRNAQQALLREQLYAGEITGAYNTAFTQALVQYQGKNCLITDGLLRKATIQSLSLGDSHQPKFICN